MRICGVDPGLQTTGYGVLEFEKSLVKIVDAGTICPNRDLTLSQRLFSVYTDLCELVAETRPQVLAVEELYSHYEHPQTAVMMGHVRGVILLCAATHAVPVRQYSATQVKKTLSGSGRASKEQVQRAVMARLGLSTCPQPYDVSDALAIALCDHFAQPEGCAKLQKSSMPARGSR